MSEDNVMQEFLVGVIPPLFPFIPFLSFPAVKRSPFQLESSQGVSDGGAL